MYEKDANFQKAYFSSLFVNVLRIYFKAYLNVLKPLLKQLFNAFDTFEYFSLYLNKEKAI